jgi:DNA-binding protein H-NS
MDTKLDQLKVVLEVSETVKEEEKEADMDSIREQINSIEDYRIIAEQLKAAKAESRQLTEKFEKLSRQINKKIKLEVKSRPIPDTGI